MCPIDHHIFMNVEASQANKGTLKEINREKLVKVHLDWNNIILFDLSIACFTLAADALGSFRIFLLVSMTE